MIKYFKGLAEPVRMRIAVLLLDRELCVCDLMEVLQLPQSTISRHMSLMKAAGLVRDRRCGKWVYYKFESGQQVGEISDLLSRNCPGSDPHRSDLENLKKHLDEKRCE